MKCACCLECYASGPPRRQSATGWGLLTAAQKSVRGLVQARVAVCRDKPENVSPRDIYMLEPSVLTRYDYDKVVSPRDRLSDVGKRVAGQGIFRRFELVDQFFAVFDWFPIKFSWSLLLCNETTAAVATPQGCHRGRSRRPPPFPLPQHPVFLPYVDNLNLIGVGTSRTETRFSFT